MNAKTQAAYNKVQALIDEESAKLERGDYIELIDELAGHLQCIQDCIAEEEKAE